MDVLSNDIIQSIVNADCEDIFAYLGQHKVDANKIAIRTFLPNATSVEILDYNTKSVVARLERIHEAGIYVAVLEQDFFDRYLIKASYVNSEDLIFEDPYRFGSTIGEQDLYLFGEGTHEAVYQFMGAHLISIDGVEGCRFCVWAPNARRVSVVGDFNFWDGRKHMMRKHIPSGIWEVFIPGIKAGDLYKYEVRGPTDTFYLIKQIHMALVRNFPLTRLRLLSMIKAMSGKTKAGKVNDIGERIVPALSQFTKFILVHGSVKRKKVIVT